MCGLSFQPYPSQEADLAELRSHGYTGLLNIQTGYGKTPLASWVIRDSGADVTLIAAPDQTIATAWEPTVPQITGREVRRIGNSKKAHREALAAFELGQPGVYVATPQFITRYRDTHTWAGDLLIVDESHQMSSPGTAGQRKLSGYSRNDRPLAQRFGARLPMSGTYLRNRFVNAWSYGRLLWFDDDHRNGYGYSNFFRWRDDHMTCHVQYTSQKDRFGRPKTVKVYDQEAIPGAWVAGAPCVITHLKRERCCEYHPNGFMTNDKPVERHEVIPLLPEQKDAIRDMETMLMTYLEDNPMVAKIPLTREQRIRQLVLGVPTVTPDGDVLFDVDCKSPYIDRLIDLLQNDMEEETCVVWTDSQSFAAVVTARLNRAGIAAFEFSGKTRDTRDRDVRDFGSKYRVAVVLLQAGSAGLDSLQFVAKNEVWLNRSTDETDNEQAMGRLDRQGQTSQVMRWFFHDDLGLSEGRFSEAIERRLVLNKSARKVV